MNGPSTRHSVMYMPIVFIKFTTDMDHVPWPRYVLHLRVDSRGDGAPPQLAVLKGEGGEARGDGSS